MWKIDEHTEDCCKFLTLTDPEGRSVLSIRVCTLEEDSNEYTIDKERLLAALNHEH